MANQMNQNPLIIDTAGITSRTADPIRIQCIQWVSDAGDIANGSLLTFQFNGVLVKLNCQLDGTPEETGQTVFYELNFTYPITLQDFEVITLSHGNVLVWLAGAGGV